VKRKTTRTTRPADPFGPLVGHRPPVLPPAASCTVVVAGVKVSSERQIRRLMVDDEAADADVVKAVQLAEELRKAKKRARDKAYREANAERIKAWHLANADRMRGYRRNWLRRNHKAVLQQQAEWKREQYYADIEASRAKARAYYHANKDRLKQQRQQRQQAAGLKSKPEVQP
jgi:hypothetical protein